MAGLLEDHAMKGIHFNSVSLRCAAAFVTGLCVTTATSARADVLEMVETMALPDLPEVQATAVAVSPDGAHVYVACGRADALVAMARDGATGELTFIEMEQDEVNGVNGLQTASSVAVSADGLFVYVSSPDDHAVAVFTRDAQTGELTFLEAKVDGVDGVDGLLGAHMVTVSPDSHHVYVAGALEDTVAVFERDQMTGTLAFVQVLRDGVGSVTGLDGVICIAVSPDGDSVYTAAFRDDAVTVFDRDPVTGYLSFVQILRDNVGGVDGLNGANAVGISPDGLNVYAVSLHQFDGENALAVFSRDPATGTLTFLQVLRDDEGGVDGLAQASCAVVSPGGAYVYVTGGQDNALAVFARDSLTGELAFVEVHIDGVDGADGLLAARWAAISPTGLNVYVSGALDDSVSVWRTQACQGDTNEDGVVNVTDLLGVIQDWGSVGSANNGDINTDGVVDVLDLVLVINLWGFCT